MTLDELIREVVVPVLAGQGFKGRGRNLKRATTDFEHLVSLAKGQRSLEGQFSISLHAHPRISGYPGLPDFPLRFGDHWLGRRLAPEGHEDRWWPSDRISRAEVAQIRELLDGPSKEWFSCLHDLEGFSGSWPEHAADLDGAARRFSTLPGRLAYLHALVAASRGDGPAAQAIADFALKRTGPQAVTLRGWIEAFQDNLAEG